MDIVILILISAALNTVPTWTISTHHVRAVSPHDYYHNAPPPPPPPPDKTNWEIGLKESTYQALLREQITDPRLKEDIYAASIEGYQDAATPFGDIAIIARGQLYYYSQPHGYHFVQDAYRNDCDDCHTPHRCDRRQCEPQTDMNADSLLALWTVKRIRHRDPKFGHRYELQFTISPMNPAANAHFVTRNGHFDYSTPGHVFIVKLREDGAETRLENVRSHFKFDRNNPIKDVKTPWIPRHPTDDELIVRHKLQTQNQYHHTPNSVLLNTGEYYITAAQEKPRPPDHGFNPAFLVGISPHGYNKHILHDLPNVADNQQFVPAHGLTTNQPAKQHYHHHFYIPEVEDVDYEHKLVRPVVPTVTTPSPKDVHPFVTTGFRPTIPHKFILTSQPQQASVRQQHQQHTTQVIPPLTTFGSSFKYPETTVPIAISPTIFTEPSYVEHPTYPSTTTLKVFTIPASHPTQPTPFSPSPFYVQYSDPDPVYSNNQPPTVPTFIAQTIPSTVHPAGTTFYTLQDEPKPQTLADLFGEIAGTQATTPTPVIASKQMHYHDSINSQLPPPEKGSDTTVPYVPSTSVTILSTTSSGSDENDAESSDRKSTTIQDATQPTTTTSATTTEHLSTKPTTTAVVFTTSFEAAQNTVPGLSEERTTVTARMDNLITTTLATTLAHSNEDIFSTVNNRPNKTKPKVIYSEEFDIFGGTKKPKDATTAVKSKERSSPTNKKPSVFDEIFGGEFRSTTTERTKLLSPHTSLTVSPESALRNARISKYLKYKRNKSDRLSKFRPNSEVERAAEKVETNGTDVMMNMDKSGIETKTSQSLITSISFKVNKNKNTSSSSSSSTTTPSSTTRATTIVQAETEGVMQADVTEMLKNDTNIRIYQVTLPDSVKTTTDRSQTFDDIAQTLVNHARVATFLNVRTTKPTKRTYRPSLR